MQQTTAAWRIEGSRCQIACQTAAEIVLEGKSLANWPILIMGYNIIEAVLHFQPEVSFSGKMSFLSLISKNFGIVHPLHGLSFISSLIPAPFKQAKCGCGAQYAQQSGVSSAQN